MERLANPEDRRSFLLRATRQGRAVATKLRGLLETLESDVLARVTARDAAGFAAVMAAIGEVTGVELRKESER